MPNRMNMAIAKTHRLSTRLVGMQITTGTLIGVCLSATQMAAGFLVVGQGLIAGNGLVAVLVTVIGILLAILIERLSLGGLSAIRVLSANLKKAQDEYYGRLREEKRDATDAEKEDLARQEKALKSSRWSARVFAGVGIALSAGLGDVFWHRLFESQGNIGYVLSTACAVVISLTFIHSELYKQMIDSVLKEILVDLHLMKTAVVAEGESMQVDLLVEAFDSVRANEDVRLPAQQKVERTVLRSLSAGADQFAQHGGTVVYEAIPAVGHGPVALLPAPRGKYAQHRDELRRLLMGNPNLSQSDIAAHFQIAKSTAGEWLKKIKAGL